MIPRTKPAPSSTNPLDTTDPKELKRRAKYYAIYPILKHDEISIIGGPSRVGKTTLAMTIIMEWQNNPYTFGCPNFPKPFCFVSRSASESTLRMVSRRVGLADEDFPIVSFSSTRPPDIADLFKHVLKAHPDTRVVFMDGLQHFLPGGQVNDSFSVGNFMAALRAEMKRHRMTVVGIGRCSKPQENRTALRTVDRFFGSTVWTEGIATFIGMERLSTLESDPRRVITVDSNERQLYTETRSFCESGRLVMLANVDDDNQTRRIQVPAQFEDSITAFPPGEDITLSDLLQMAEMLNISERSCYRHLTNLCDRGVLVKSGRGVYRVPREQ